MSMFICPSCKTETRQLIAYEYPVRKVGCRFCGTPKEKRTNCNLGQTEQKWVGPNGKVHRLTVGKSWEIERRRLSKDDNMTVVNYETGKETQR